MPTAILQPNDIGSHENDWTQNGGSGRVNAVDAGDPIVHDDATSRMSANVKGKKQSYKFESFTTLVPLAKEVISMDFNLRLRFTDIPTTNSLIVWSTNSVPQIGNFFTIPIPVSVGLGSFVDFHAKLPPADGGDWTLAKADDAEIRWLLNEGAPDGLVDCTSTWLVPEYALAITLVQPDDETARRQLRQHHHVQEIYKLELGPRAEQLEMFQDFRLEDAFGPEASGTGFGTEEWESRLLRCVHKIVNPKTGNVTVLAIDLRRYLTTFFLSGISDRPGKTTGTVRMDQGVKEIFGRAGKSWIESNDGRVYEVANDVKKHNHLGLLIEKERTNRLANSAFHIDGGGGADVFASWSEVTGAGATIVADATNRYFEDVAVVKQHCKLTAGSPVGGVAIDQATVFTFPVSTDVVLSVVHQDDVASGELRWDVQNQNGASLNWFNAGTGLWQGTRPGNDFTLRSSRFRDTVTFRTESVNAGALLLRLVGEKTSSQVNHIWQVDLVDQVDYATSPILTTTVQLERKADELKYENKLGAEVIPVPFGEQFTIQMVLRMQFGSADVFAEAEHYLIAVKGAGSRFGALLYVDTSGGPDNAFTFRDDTNGIISGARVKPTFLAGEEIKLVWRRSSFRGEYDLVPNADQLLCLDPSTGLWLEGTPFPANDRSFNPATDQEVRIGYEDFLGGGFDNQIDAYIDWFDVRSFCLQIEEAKDFP